MPPHDTLWKTLLQTFLTSLLRLVAPGIAPPDRILFLDKELFPSAPHGERREADVLARLSGGGGSLLVHVEVEARYGKAILRRLEQYYHLLQARYGEPVYSILLTLRGGPGGIRTLRQEQSVAGQRRLFEHTSVGLGGFDAAALLASSEPIAWAFAALAPCRGRQKPARKIACLDRVAKARLSAYESFLLVNAVETYLKLNPEQRTAYEALKLQQEDRTVQKIELTWADEMRNEGRQQGALHLLKHLLSRRFGELSGATLAKVEAIRSVSRLTVLAEQALSARSLEEMGL